MRLDMKLTVAIFGLTWMAGGSPVLAGNLQDAIDRVASAKIVAIDASVTVEIIAPEVCECCGCEFESGQVISGYMQYYADGEKWHNISRMGPAYPLMNAEAAFNGDTFSYLQDQSATLSITTNTTDPDNIGPQLPIPPLLMMQFLVPLTDSNSMREPQLRDLRQAASQTDVSGLVWTPATIGGRPYDRAELPGGHYEGHDYIHAIYARSGAHDQPSIIDRVTLTGQILSRTSFSHYETVTSLDTTEASWPRNVVIQAFEPATGDLMVEMSMIVNWIALGDEAALPADAFALQPEPGLRVLLNGVHAEQE